MIPSNVVHLDRNSLRSDYYFRRVVRLYRGCIARGENPREEPELVPAEEDSDDDAEPRDGRVCDPTESERQRDSDGGGCACDPPAGTECQCDLGKAGAEKDPTWVSELNSDIEQEQIAIDTQKAPAKQVRYYALCVKSLKEVLQKGEQGSWALLENHKHFGAPTEEMFVGAACTWQLRYTYRRALITCNFVQGLIRTFQKASGMFGLTLRQVAERIAEESVFDTSPASVIRYWYDFAKKDAKRVGSGRFKWSMQGKHQRRWLLDHEDLKRELIDWMIAQGDKLSVDGAHAYINDILLKDLTEDAAAACGLELPIVKSTAHSWMKKAGAHSDWFKQSCYTDKHNEEQTVAYRNEYIAERRIMQRSEFAWVCLTEAQMSELRQRETALRAATKGTCEQLEDAAGTGAAAATKIHELLETGIRGKYPEVFLLPDGAPQENGLDWKKTGGGSDGTYFDQDDWLEFEDRTKFPRTLHPESGVVFDAAGAPAKPTKSAWQKTGVRSDLQKKQSLCPRNHTYEVCCCHKPTLRIGQDESVYHSHAQSRKQWVVNGNRPLRPKGQGAGEMWSLFTEHVRRGFGIEMTMTELARVNTARAEINWKPLIESPGARCLVYGKNKEGYWDYNHMEIQTRDVIHAYEVLHPQFQIVLEMDWSSGHAKKASGALDASNTGIYFGGAKPPQRASKILRGCVGPNARGLKMWFRKYQRGERGVNRGESRTGEWFLTKVASSVEVKVGAEEGRNQLMVFDRSASTATRGGAAAEQTPIPPPWYQLDAPLVDEIAGTKEVKSDSKKGGPSTVTLEDKISPGYVGKPKGIKQILWERGLWVDGMTRHGPKGTDTSVASAEAALSKCPDFLAQRPAMDEFLTSKGQNLLMTPKCHPELAGDGVEFDWGISKKYQRKHNTCRPKNLHGLCKESFQHVNRDGPNGEAHYYVKRMARQSRRYLAAYESGKVSHPDVLKFMSTHKCHRNILDQETALLERALNGDCMDTSVELSTNAKPVSKLNPTTLEVVEVYPSRQLAATAVGAAGGEAISSAIRTRNIAYGYRWK
jgi:hypothetical protein